MRTFQRIARLIRPAVGLPVLAALAFVGLIVLALGCGPDRDVGPQPAADTRLADIPVPETFKFDAQRSTDRTTGALRFVEHVYKGSHPLGDVADFYRREMPVLGWRLVEERFDHGRQRFHFEKDREACHISLWDDWGTRLMIQIFPRKADTP